MSVSTAPVKVPTLHVKNFVDSYHLTHGQIESTHYECSGGYWIGGVYHSGSVDSEAIEERAWDEWFTHLTDTIEAIEKDYGFHIDDEHPQYAGYCLLMHRRLTELASEMSEVIDKARHSELMKLANEYAPAIAPLPQLVAAY